MSGTRHSPDRRRGVAAGVGTRARLVGSPAVDDSGHDAILAQGRFGQPTWAATLTRLLLGLVFAWFGYHELVDPRQWTGYVPILPETSTASVVLVLAHGMLLFVLAVALVAGVAPRAAGAIGALCMLEVVVSLAASGINDIVVRDVGVLGLALAVAATQSRGVLKR